jgi:ankyrin repeat protein
MPDTRLQAMSHHDKIAMLYSCLASADDKMLTKILALNDERLKLDGRNPLHTESINNYKIRMCAKNGDPNNDLDALLGRSEININAANKQGDTALMLAVREGHAEVVTTLLSGHADITYTNKDGVTALMWAAIGGHQAVVEQLLIYAKDKNKEANQMTILQKHSVLHWAARGGNPDVVNTLLMAGADIHHKSLTGKSPLQRALKEGNLEVARCIQRAYEPLLQQAYQQMRSAFQQHRAKKATVGTKQKQGAQTVTVLAVGEPARCEAMENLLKEGADPSNVLKEALGYGSDSVVHAIQEAYAEVNEKAGQFYMALNQSMLETSGSISEESVKAITDCINGLSEQQREVCALCCCLPKETDRLRALPKKGYFSGFFKSETPLDKFMKIVNQHSQSYGKSRPELGSSGPGLGGGGGKDL